MASRKEYEMLFSLNAQLGNSYNSTFNKAQKQLASIQKEIQTLSKTQSDISAFQKQQSAAESMRSKLELLQKQYDNIQAEMEDTGGNSSELANKLLAKQQQIQKATEALRQQTEKLNQMGNALKSAGVNTNHLSSESEELSAKIRALRGEQEKAAESAKNLGDSSNKAAEALVGALTGAGAITALRKYYELLGDCSEASVAFESGITGVFKTVDGTDAELAAITKEIKEMTTEIPAAKTEISSVAEAAGQLGIATKDVMDFTKVMIDLGESTNLTATEGASDLAKFANITKTASENYSRLGSTIVDLGNKNATTEADIVAMATRLASAGTLAKLTEPQILGLAASMSSVGIEAEAGGTSMTQTLSAIEKAVATKSKKLSEFARIAGMTAGEFAESWESSPIEALQSFITGLGKLDEQGESAVLVLDELGLTGVRQGNMLKSLGLAAETLGSAIQTANKAWDENTALTVEAEKRYATLESKQKMVANSYDNFAVAIGDVYTPALRKLYDVEISLLGNATEFVEEHPGLVSGVTTFTGVIATATGALMAYAAAAKIVKALNMAALFTGPAGAALGAVAGVAALTGAIVGLTTAADDGVPSVKELTESARDMAEVINEASEAYELTSDEITATAAVAEVYVEKLREMEAAGVDTEEEQAEWHSTLTLLTELMPELADKINLTTGEIEGGTKALEDNIDAWVRKAQAEAYQEQISEMTKAYSQTLVENEINVQKLAQAEAEYAAAEKERQEILKRRAEIEAEAEISAEELGLTEEQNKERLKALADEHTELFDELLKVEEEYETSRLEVQRYTEAIDILADSVADAKAKIAETKSAIASLTGGTVTIDGYAGGTNHAERGFKMVGENGPELVFFNGGEVVKTASETAALARELSVSAQPMSALPMSGGGKEVVYSVQFAPVYHLSGAADSSEIRAILERHDNELKAQLEELLEEIEEDKRRRAYA